MTSDLSVVIAWRNRPEIERTLSVNVPVIGKYNIGLVIVNCGGDAAELTRIAHAAKVRGLLIHVRDAAFNKSMALNIGCMHAESPYIFVLDSDIVLCESFIPTYLDCLGPDRVITMNRVRETAGNSIGLNRRAGLGQCVKDVITTQITEVVWSDGAVTSVPSFRFYFRDSSRGGQGQLITSKEAMMQVQGYNSNFSGWGFEDLDIIIRLQRALRIEHVQIGEVVHLSHDDNMRDLEGKSRSESNLQNFDVACEHYSRGNLMGTLLSDVQRNRDKIDIEMLNGGNNYA